MNETPIAWTELTWNPMSGCVPVSEGCRHCYARTFAERKRGTPAFPNGFDLTLRPHKLREPERVKSPSLVFVNSMSDLFWDAVPETYRDQVMTTIERCPRHTFQILTKRPEAMRDYSHRLPFAPNVWAGVTVESQSHVDRIDVLRQVDAHLRFVSVEPMLSPLPGLSLAGVDWVIVGGESGSHLWKHPDRGLVERRAGAWSPRPERVQWVLDVRDQCHAAGVPFFFKQWGGPLPTSGGKLLDGRAWAEFPSPRSRA
ncbi:MAG: phage Gp37/Gp68 family protein [Patescibacteria group bacterium]|jgi:protein gp37